jgi:hypothetical protein
MKYARIVDEIAIETFEPPEGVQIEDCFHPSLVAQFVQVPDEVVANSVRNEDGTWTLPVVEDIVTPVPEGPPQDEPDVIS